MAYVKLFAEILDSTIWREPATTKVTWITMMAMANRDGEVMASVPGLAIRADVTLEQCEKALAAFLAPDKYSRTKTNEGRRIEEIDGGWRLFNYEKFRLKMSREESNEKAAIRMARMRERNKLPSSVTPVTSHASYDIASPSAKAEAKVPDTEPSAAPKAAVYPKEFDLIWTQTGERGGKDPAFKVWTKVGRPSWSVIQAPYLAYLRSERPMAGERYIQNLSTWLTNLGWQKEWKPAASIKTSIEFKPTDVPARGLVHKPKGL